MEPVLSPLRCRRVAAVHQGTGESELAATPILDWKHPRVLRLASEARHENTGTDRGLLVTAHRLIATRVRPVYAMNDTQPVSRTLLLERGSCSQRLAVLEAVGRAGGIASRVRGLLVDGRFWHPRFPRLRALIPHQIVLAWPEFLLGDQWVTVSELYGDLSTLQKGGGFTNTGGETLFDAVAHTAVDWDGVTCSSCDLSGHVLSDLGYFSSRDALFRTHGQTLCLPVRIIADLIMSRRVA
ncbi:transglutaminase domain-containing protein [Streptosporangium amethystogenes]|uniref:transglutaminase domain-containing protein n=1 Tax=Streptosporangium amethystogenes TaxID=2002 RepID=UPI00069216A3|nr:transglutaminase domain-containing protein [Streptosporangium amethystogenes]